MCWWFRINRLLLVFTAVCCFSDGFWIPTGNHLIRFHVCVLANLRVLLCHTALHVRHYPASLRGKYIYEEPLINCYIVQRSTCAAVKLIVLACDATCWYWGRKFSHAIRSKLLAVCEKSHRTCTFPYYVETTTLVWSKPNYAGLV